jgi:hypothetical protein
MIRIFRIAFAGILLASALWGTAFAEKTFSVNDNDTGVFDQPSVVLNGSVANVAYIGGSGTAGPFTVFFAAVNGGADFTNLLLPRDSTVLPITPVAIDNTGAGGNAAYFDARHPKIALRSASEVVILFQARAAATDDFYRPYVARLAVTANSAALISVRQMEGFPAGVLSTGDIEDISYNLVLTDNTARMAFANRPTISSASPFQVWFARVLLDNASVVQTLPLSSGDNNTVTGSDGFRPVPSLNLDALGNSHVAWAANDNTPNPGAVYYAMVTSTAAVDNVGIGATEVLGRTLSWGHPTVMVLATNSVILLAGDESFPGSAGSIGIATLNPDAVAPKNGLPVSIGLVRSFLVTGPNILPSTFDLYRPEAFLDASARIHMTGYGASGSSATYYAMKLTVAFPFAELVTTPAPVGLNEFPAELPGDYTKAAFRFLSGKTIVFWSGLIPGSANRNLNVTTVQAVIDVPPSEESGCSMVVDPRTGEAGRIPGAALLFLPAAALAVRRFSQGFRRKPRRSVAD